MRGAVLTQMGDRWFPAGRRRRHRTSMAVKVVIVAAAQMAVPAVLPGLAVSAPIRARLAPLSSSGTVVVPGASELTSISCNGTTVCVAAGQGTTSGGKTEHGSTPADAVAVSFAPAGSLAGHRSRIAVSPVANLAQNVNVRSVVCVSPTRCEVLGYARTRSEVIAFDPATGTIAKPIVLPHFNGSAAAMACPTNFRCLIVGGAYGSTPARTRGEVMVFYPSSGQLGPHVTTTLAAFSISCPTTAVCELAGYTSQDAVFARLGVASLRVAGVVASGASGLYSLSCASVHACEAVGFASYANGGHFGVLVSVDPVSGLVTLFQQTKDTLAGVYCLPSSSAPTTTCEAPGSNSSGSGYVMPVMDGILDGGDAVTGSTFLYAASCPIATICVRVGYTGQPDQGSGQGQGVLSVQQIVLKNDNTTAACPGSGTAEDKPLHPSSRFDDITDKRSGGFGGVYAHISFAPDCRDKSNPATSSWVMLQAGNTTYSGCGHRSFVFVQAGIFYSYPSSRANSEHAFAEVDYPCLGGQNGTREFDQQAVSSGTFAVEDLGLSKSHANCPGVPGPAGGDHTDKVVDRVETTLNGKCLWTVDLPAKYAGRMSWANLSSEIHTYTARVPGDYQYPLAFTQAHVYFGGRWMNFTSDGSGRDGNPSSPPHQTVVDATINGGTGCQLNSPVGGANWAVYMWSANQAGQCNPYSSG